MPSKAQMVLHMAVQKRTEPRNCRKNVKKNRVGERHSTPVNIFNLGNLANGNKQYR